MPCPGDRPWSVSSGNSFVGFAVDLKAAHREHDRIGWRSDDKIAVGDASLIAGREDEKLAALSLVGAEGANIRKITLQSVLKKAEHFGWRFDDCRSFRLKKEMTDRIDRLGVGRQQNRLGSHQLFPDDEL